MGRKQKLAAKKAVRTMRAKKEARARHRYQPFSSRIPEVLLEQKTRKSGRARKAVAHRKR